MSKPPTFEHEKEFLAHGYRLVAGVDEVGRGAIAGPVAAAAVILPCEDNIFWLPLVRDSKELSPSRRELLSRLIRSDAVATGVGMASSHYIDAFGIVLATQLAMCRAIEQLSVSPDSVLIDAMNLPLNSIPQRAIIHGDRLSLSIACASILAKVVRDQYMVELNSLYCGYGLAHHKGYATKRHLLSLRQLGPCPIHRLSFAPVGRLAR